MHIVYKSRLEKYDRPNIKIEDTELIIEYLCLLKSPSKKIKLMTLKIKKIKAMTERI